MKRTILLLVIVFAVGMVFGSTVNEDPQPEFIEVPRTKIVHESAPPPEQIEVFPESCQKAVAYAEDIVRASEALYSSGEEQLDILAQARLYLAAHRNTKPVDERQRRLHGRTIKNLLNLEENYARFNSAMEKCDD